MEGSTLFAFAARRLAVHHAPRVFMQQEENHVVLSEELRYRSEFIGPDLHLGQIDGVLLIALPELVDPAKTVLCRENPRGQTGKLLFKFLAGLWQEDSTRGQDRRAERLQAASVVRTKPRSTASPHSARGPVPSLLPTTSARRNPDE